MIWSVRTVIIPMLAATAGAWLVAEPVLAAPSGGGGGASSGFEPTPSQQIDPQKSYADGIAALKAEDFKTAEKKFEEVLSVAPKNPEANYFLGVAKVERGKAKASVKYFEKAIKERANFTEARERLALVQIELGKPEKASEQLDAMKAQQAACASESCGEPFVARLAEAIAGVEAALAAPAADTPADDAEDDEVSFAPQGVDQLAGLFLAGGADAGAARYRDAVRLINEARFEAAIEDLALAQAISGPHPDILNYLGYANRKLGRFEEAQNYYAQALAINPDHLGANEYLGELYAEIGDAAKARRQLAKLDRLCTFGCAEREDLARLIEIRESDRRAAK